MADYRTGGVTLQQLMALTITGDHAVQEAAFYAAPDWQRSALALRERLTEHEIDASHPLVHFIGMDAYRRRMAASAATCSPTTIAAPI